MGKLTTGAYYYPGWHGCKVRDASFPRGWSEWQLVYNCKPSFDGHEQPKLPLWGAENEADPEVFSKKLDTAAEYGVNLFVFAYYWSRGKRLLEGALKDGFLKSRARGRTDFALMWANRMPRKVMPVKDAAARLIDPTRLVYTDPADFLDFIDFIARNYFVEPDYYKVDGASYLSIFDTAFFIRQLGAELAAETINKARKMLAERSMKLHLAAIDPIPEHQPLLKKIGFDSVTHYVFLPDWSGDYLQDYNTCANTRVSQWRHYQSATGLPYVPSVTPGWDANPRATDYGKEKPQKYPWSPILTGTSPENFADFLAQAKKFACEESMFLHPMLMISSWNEWSEGHYLEPDQKYGFSWLEAVKRVCSHG
ncbi:MAG: glycoside hydrolase family 99-like domain-containing protein [Candidatus Riflebacteria bacterium]|nr:glycoside hydrolase family 99-like domain-containing protein [Candidatus Riflebacteria bacterium]